MSIGTPVWSERSAERNAGSRRAEDWRHSDLFSERERVALDYAEAVTRSDLEVTDELMARVQQQFDDDALVELTALIAFQGISSKSTPRSTWRRRGFAGCRRRPGRGRTGRSVLNHSKALVCRAGGAMMRNGLLTALLGATLLSTGSAWAQRGEAYWGPQMMWGGWFHMFFGFLMMLLFLGILVGLVVLVVRWLGSSEHSPFRHAPGVGARSALDILKKRLARGEIDVAEFEERRRAIGE